MKFSLLLKKAPFPTSLTFISFVLFIVLYYFLTIRSIEPYYFIGLIFVIPFICFGFITYFTISGKLNNVTSIITTSVLMVLLGIIMFITFMLIALDAATTVITDVGNYQRVLKLTGYPDNELTQCFPNKIPSNARNVIFRYNHPALQGGESFSLKYKIDSDTINYDINQFSQKAIWIGKMNDSVAYKYGISPSRFINVGYDKLPEDFNIYLMGVNTADWNHGDISLVAISKQRNEIIFLAEDW